MLGLAVRRVSVRFDAHKGTNGMSLAPARREALLDNFRGILVTALVSIKAAWILW